MGDLKVCTELGVGVRKNRAAVRDLAASTNGAYITDRERGEVEAGIRTVDGFLWLDPSAWQALAKSPFNGEGRLNRYPTCDPGNRAASWISHTNRRPNNYRLDSLNNAVS